MQQMVSILQVQQNHSLSLCLASWLLSSLCSASIFPRQMAYNLHRRFFLELVYPQLIISNQRVEEELWQECFGVVPLCHGQRALQQLPVIAFGYSQLALLQDRSG